ncbi:hypothetical protein PVAP13_2NG061000 [Panicum virgatum]|uniref:Uncharacterized protein n=1 Tax=Panicum virgatum TaxID=38727 RepID=A0A8T0VBE4_PANVG|nr:hypothetical protein PVAP13_2NG061000 [Panicum virgatum]
MNNWLDDAINYCLMDALNQLVDLETTNVLNKLLHGPSFRTSLIKKKSRSSLAYAQFDDHKFWHIYDLIL